MGRNSDSERPFGNGGGSEASTPDVLPSWLLMAKVTAPAPPTGYVRRASLLHRVDTVLDRRLTVLQAPGGFGKTTVLADVSHRKKKQGVIAAWLSLDPGRHGGRVRTLPRARVRARGSESLHDRRR